MTETKLKLEDWLDDLCVRFIINLPQEELESVERICFQVEEAQWYYEDFARPLDPSLPSLPLRQFCLLIFQHCPLLAQFSHHHHLTAFDEFLAYKTRVPVRGAILLNEEMDELVLVKGWKKASNWSFPRGKINKDEKDFDCAVREVYEETGYDIKEAGLGADEENTKFIEITMREQNMRLYVFRGVEKDTYFEPRTRKEISKIEWHRLAELPTFKKSKQQRQQDQNGNELAANAHKFYMVAPFLVPLRKWIAQQKKQDARKPQARHLAPLHQQGNTTTEEEPTTEYEAAGLISDAASHHRVENHSSLPEVSDTESSGKIASATLKSLLNVGSTKLPSSLDSTHLTEDGANPLMALLRNGGRGTSTDLISRQENIHTPSEAVNKTPTMPATPHHHNPNPPHVEGLPLPPAFPIAPSQTLHAPSQPELDVREAHGRPAQTHEAGTGPGPTGPSTRAPIMPIQYPQQHSQSRQSNVSPLRPSGVASTARSYQTVPYAEQHGLVSSGSHPSRLPSTPGHLIPSASSLPPPKLTSHTLSMLDLLKSGGSRQAPFAAEIGGGRREEAPTQPAHAAKSSTSQSVAEPRRSIGLEDSHFFGQADPAKPTGRFADLRAHSSNHFASGARGPVQPAHTVPKPTQLHLSKNDSRVATPPSIPVELSAQRSPALPLRQEFLVQSPTLTSNPPSSINSGTAAYEPTRENTPQGYGLSPVQNGNAPRAPSYHSAGRNPIAILQRPKSELDGRTMAGSVDKPSKISTGRSAPPNGTSTVDTLVSPSPAQPSPGRAITGPGHLPLHERNNKSAEHKKLLLSMFNGQPPLPKPRVRTYSNGRPIEPLATLSPQPSRMSSMLSNTSASAVLAQTPSATQTPKTPQTPSDKGFLLGYLEGVAKERRQ
ncbi:MAG: mRNA-decapping enzyme subunit 2 [Piccolia ochrophora]|nr:MAG: mRNA-decapping enzyme subunit 2 [Piccolia ochrophora]